MPRCTARSNTIQINSCLDALLTSIEDFADLVVVGCQWIGRNVMQDGKIVSSSIQLRVHSKMNEIRGQPRDEIWRKERRGKKKENKSMCSTFVAFWRYAVCKPQLVQMYKYTTAELFGGKRCAMPRQKKPENASQRSLGLQFTSNTVAVHVELMEAKNISLP